MCVCVCGNILVGGKIYTFVAHHIKRTQEGVDG